MARFKKKTDPVVKLASVIRRRDRAVVEGDRETADSCRAAIAALRAAVPEADDLAFVQAAADRSQNTPECDDLELLGMVR